MSFVSDSQQPIEEPPAPKVSRRRLTKVEKEIYLAQAGVDHLIPRACFKRLAKQYLNGKNISAEALFLLQEGTEDMMTSKLAAAAKVARGCRRDTVNDEHLRLACELQQNC
jgi:histone H3/H4